MSGGSLTQDALDLAIAEAKASGFEVVQSDHTTLLVDLDTPEARVQFDRVFPLVAEYYGIEFVHMWTSKSGNWHAAVKLLTPLAVTERFLLQAALGSDGKREVLGLIQVQNGCIEPSILFRPMKGQA